MEKQQKTKLVKLAKADKPVNENDGQMTVEERYKKKSLHEHILLLPDSYIGSVDSDVRDMWVWSNDDDMIIKKNISFPPGLYKIFDEIIVNARDQSVRDKTCKNIKVSISKETGMISVWNDGNGIPIEIHKEYNIYVPELIFGNLLTGENYNKSEDKTVGGKNGYGAKLANIYSTEFHVETVDMKQKKKYYQKFTSNMYQKDEPVITAVTNKQIPYTKISFVADFAKFGIENLTDDIIELFQKRAYDLARCAGGGIKVYFNDKTHS